MLPIDRNVKSAHYPPQKDWFINMEPPLTPYIFEQHISLSIKRDQKIISKPQKKKVFSIFLKALWDHHFRAS